MGDDAFTNLLVIGHQHQLDVLGLRQDVSLLLQMEQRDIRGHIHPLPVKCIVGVVVEWCLTLCVGGRWRTGETAV